MSSSDFKSIKNAEVSVASRGHLKALESGQTVETSAKMYIDIMAYLCSTILVTTGHRSGVVRNMRLGEVRSALRKSSPDGIEKVVTVLDHKTGYLAPAHVSLPEALYNKLMTYIEKLRNNRFMDINAREVFVKYSNGKKPTILPNFQAC